MTIYTKNEISPPQATGDLKSMERPKGRGIKPKLRNKVVFSITSKGNDIY
jgi:hypothetical protein